VTTKKLPLLGGLTAAQFLRDYWQKKPLLVRNAFPAFNGLLAANDLLLLAQDENVQSRLVQYQNKKWDLQHGPFSKKTFNQLPKKNWTLLLQELNHHVSTATDLLQNFSFIPHSRLDDLMVSYAVPGGGVGAHVDSYDVFLLQGEGARRWEISDQKDLSLVADAPLKLLKKFTPQLSWDLGPGDMLYLPPRYAHKGTALTPCTTYSIGFRAPSHQELASEFLNYLHDHISLEGQYADPNLKTQKHPAEISRDMVNQVKTILNKIQTNQDVTASFLGAYLSEPKAHIFFDSPQNELSEKKFLTLAQARGVMLAPESLMLFVKDRFFMNGEMFTAAKSDLAFFVRLADKRLAHLTQPFSPTVIAQLHNWYNNGYIRFIE
jgi:50S ribosomal protein L16 3-hydroxylase